MCCDGLIQWAGVLQRTFKAAYHPCFCTHFLSPGLTACCVDRVPQFGDLVGKRGLVLVMLDGLRKKMGLGPGKDGTGCANTALTYHAGRLLTLHEGDLPYQV